MKLGMSMSFSSPFGCTPRIVAPVNMPSNSSSIGPITYGETPWKVGYSFCSRSCSDSQSFSGPAALLTRKCGSKPTRCERSSRSKPLITAMTTTSDMMPSATPSTESTVITETNVRFGFR